MTSGSLLEPGRNCWRLETAGRVAILLDAANYFSFLLAAIGEARRSLLVLGWAFDARVALDPDRPEATALHTLLLAQVERHPELHVHILVFDYAALIGPGRALPLLVGEAWQRHPRIHFRLDHDHLPGAAHHQKVVCIDDALACVGGIDLTVSRWDTPTHAVRDPRRARPDGMRYGPIHDVTMAVDGDAAKAVAALARQRWRRATGEALAPVGEALDLWPHAFPADFGPCAVGIVRTDSRPAAGRSLREVEAFVSDALRAARRWIYLETQYLTARLVGEVLAERLAEPAGPEVVILLTGRFHNLIEQWLMGTNRDRLVRRLARADRYGRLRVYRLAVSGSPDKEVLVHAKLLVADDDLLKVGSANLDNRSLGLDTECDLAIEARDEPTRAAVAGLRDRLLAHHLGVPPAAVGALIRRHASLIGAIEALDPQGLRLRPLALDPGGPTTPLPGTSLFDPERPLALPWCRSGSSPDDPEGAR